MNNINELEKLLKYNFSNKNLLLEAVTHPSMSYKQKKKERFNYERLEFLGDSLLSAIISSYLFIKFPHETEGTLSKKKSVLVSKNMLYKIANTLDLGKFIIMTKGEANTNGRHNINNLENTMEAIIGAIYLDSNDFKKTEKFVMSLWKDFLDINTLYSSKTILQELVQKKYKKLPEYKLDNTEIIDKQEIFTISLLIPNLNVITRSGKNIKEIEKELANEAIKIINKSNFN